MEEKENSKPSLDGDALLDLVKRIQCGDQNSIVTLRDRLKGFILWVKRSRDFLSSISDGDALDNCLLPVYNAAQNYDFSLENKFSTYVYYYIYSELVALVNENLNFSIPDKIRRLCPKVIQIINDYVLENEGKEPSNKEIQSILLENEVDVSLEDVESCRTVFLIAKPIDLSTNDKEESFNVLDIAECSTTESYLNIDEIFNLADITEREKRIFLLKEEKGLKIEEIAKNEKVSPSVVFRILQRVRAKIYRKKKDIGVI